MLGRDLLQRAVFLQLLDRGAERGAHLLVRRAVIDPERVRLRKQVGERELARMGLLLKCTRGVLGQDSIGASDQKLRDGIRVTRIALQRELRPPRRLELLVERFEVLLVLGARLKGDELAGQVVWALDLLRIPRL